MTSGSDDGRPVVVLASASTGRLSVLRNAGIEPRVLVSGVDEEAVVAAHTGDGPREVVAALAAAKADAVVREHAADPELSDAVVIGGDSMLLFDGELQGKPRTREETLRRWAAQSGRPGVLLSGLAVVRLRSGRVVRAARDAAEATVTFTSPSAREMDAYIASGEPLQVAGAFTIDGLGGWFVDRIEGDPSCVVGLSLPLLRRMLRDVGLTVTDLWNRSSAL